MKTIFKKPGLAPAKRGQEPDLALARQLEDRFIAAVIKDDEGIRWRECRGLHPEVFSDYARRQVWAEIAFAKSYEDAAIKPNVLPYFANETTGIDYITDRDALFFVALRMRGLSYAHDWIKTLPSAGAASRFPEFEHEPAETDILVEVEPIIEGLLEAGDKMSISSGSKSFKTWNLIQLGLAIQTGTPWLGFATHPQRVLFLNFEIKRANFWKRVYRVRRALGLDKSAKFTVWNLRGMGFSMDDHADELIRRAQEIGAGVIILDPIYKLFGDRNESSAGDMATLMSLFDKVATETGSAVVYAHHYAKGNAAAKDAIDRSSGSGVFSRDPDCLIALTRLDKEEHPNGFSVDVTLRDFPPVDEFAVRRDHPLMVRDENLNPKNLHEANRRQKQYDPKELVKVLPPEGMTITEWQGAARARFKIGKTTFYEYAPEAKKLARLQDKKWFPITSDDAPLPSS